MKNKKIKFIAILLALICLFVVVVGSLAYFSTETRARNIITTGKVAIVLHEAADEQGTPFTDVTGVMPGATIPKIVTVENENDSSPVWVRVKVDKRITLAAGADGTADPSLVSLDIDTANWTEHDGWYYYNTPLQPGQTTTPLFTQVSFATSMENFYQNSTAEVNVLAQAVQQPHNHESGPAYEAEGWPAVGTSETEPPADPGPGTGGNEP